MWANLHMTNMQDALKRNGWNWSKDFSSAKEVRDMTAMNLAWDLGELCDAGVETTATQLQLFILACLACTEWIHTAQKELDDVVGPDRLTDFEDLKNLPYIIMIHTVVEETFRWRHIVPSGVPHSNSRADNYNGYLIPNDSIIVPVTKAMREIKWIGTVIHSSSALSE